MSDLSFSSPSRRPELEQIFQHLAEAAASVDLSGCDTPAQQWLIATRAMVDRYGDIGPAVSLDGVAFTPVVANGVRAYWVTADGANHARRLVYLHGGGWSSGTPEGYKVFQATLARLSKASILFVDYRLAPEHPFPAPLDDCVAAFQWALVNGPSSEAAGLAGRDPAERICLAGDSAGGNLSAATCVRQVNSRGRLPDRMALIGAALDLTLVRTVRENVWLWAREGIDDGIVSPETLAFSVESYLLPAQPAANPEVSPALTPLATLRMFPPTLLQVSAIEVLEYDSRAFADRLEKAGVRVNLSLWPGMPHVWHAFQGLLPEAAEAIAELADFLNR